MHDRALALTLTCCVTLSKSFPLSLSLPRGVVTEPWLPEELFNSHLLQAPTHTHGARSLSGAWALMFIRALHLGGPQKLPRSRSSDLSREKVGGAAGITGSLGLGAEGRMQGTGQAERPCSVAQGLLGVGRGPRSREPESSQGPGGGAPC